MRIALIEKRIPIKNTDNIKLCRDIFNTIGSRNIKLYIYFKKNVNI